ncbi:MAG: sialate O-acetylesterase [Clostridia bacterium]
MDEENKESIKFKISGAISSDMVFQRNEKIRIWGTAERNGLKIYGEFMGEKIETRTEDSGRWILEFSPHSATLKPQSMKIYAEEGEAVILENLLIGDVYFITGQSNAELNLNCCISATPEDKNDLQSDTIRLFAQSREYVIEHPELWNTPQEDIIHPDWKWERTTEETAYKFSALGYYFGKELSKTIKEIPIGLIMAAAGGAQIVELMPEETARQQGYTVSAAVGIAGYYNTLIHPFIKMPVRAVLFYQGESESNPENCPHYGDDLAAFVNVLRGRWNIPFRFYNVQLSSHGKGSYEYWPSIGELRAAQYQAIKEIPDYYVTVAMDCGFAEGDPDFAHPLYKKVPGQRLAKLILSTEYGILDMEYASSPYPVSVEWAEDRALLTFRYVGNGLKTFTENDALIGFQIEQNGERKDAVAQIVGRNTVQVRFNTNADAICYGMQQTAGTDVANLVNSELLPAPAFRMAR